MYGRGAPSSGRPAAVQDRRGLAGRGTRCLGVSVSHACWHARARAHIQYLVLQEEDRNISIFSPAIRGPYPASPFPLARLHQRCQPQGAFRLLPCVFLSVRTWVSLSTLVVLKFCRTF